MKTDKKVSVTYKGVTYDDAQNPELGPDDAAYKARNEAFAGSAAEQVAVTLPMYVWRVLLPGVVENFHRGAHGVGRLREQLEEVEDRITDADRVQAEEVLRHDSELAGLLRWAIETATKQIGEQLAEADPFFKVDFPELVDHQVDHVYHMVERLADEDVARISSVEHAQIYADMIYAEAREEEAQAKDTVTRELAKFANDTDTSGKTLN